MKITKYGHSCLLVEENRVKILIDPGSYSSVPENLEDISAVLITHEHQDHFSMETIWKIVANNSTRLISNASVLAKLKAENLLGELLEDGQSVNIDGVMVEGFGKDHAVIYPTLPSLHNTGYRIAERFFYGGDALIPPGVPVEILAYPAIAPWMKVSEAVDYAKAVKPKILFPVHDAFLTTLTGGFYNLAKNELSATGAQWIELKIGKPVEF